MRIISEKEVPERKMEKYIGTRVPDALEAKIQHSIDHNMYASLSEFLRAAIREKLERENQ